MKLPFPLQESEKILLVCRRHWLFLYPGLVLRLVAALAPVLALVLLLRAAGTFDGIGLKIALVVSAVWLIFWAVNIFLFKYSYDNDLWTITDQRIVDSVRPNPLALKMVAADLINILDTSVNRSGLLPTFFNFGDIACETAGERESFALKKIPHPQEVHALIDRERDRQRKETHTI
jgi:hypothetical protein